MNYQHSYHAGNFADVMKHVILIDLLNLLSQKEKPLCYLDTHAGRGCYDLYTAPAKITGEYVGGIQRVATASNPPQQVQTYLNVVSAFNLAMLQSMYQSDQPTARNGKTTDQATDQATDSVAVCKKKSKRNERDNKKNKAPFILPRFYPGSPQIARSVLGSENRTIACELHRETYQLLKHHFYHSKGMETHHLDGFLGLKAFLPPKERRGLILLDPPYENAQEFSVLAKNLALAVTRWATGVYAVWYPIKDRERVAHFHHHLRRAIPRPMLAVELTIAKDLPQHLSGSGLVIINPPWQFTASLKGYLEWLWQALSAEQEGGYAVFAL